MYDFEHMDKRLLIYANIFLLANKLQAVMDTELEEVTGKQWLALIVLGVFQKPPTLTEMAKMCNTSHQNTKQIILRLCEKGYVRIIKDKKDSRAMRIVPTEKVEQLNKRYEQQSQQFIDEMFAGLSEEEIAIMNKAQFKISERLEQIEAESKVKKSKVDKQ